MLVDQIYTELTQKGFVSDESEMEIFDCNKEVDCFVRLRTKEVLAWFGEILMVVMLVMI